MDLDENTDVLDEVETLFKKLETLPENVKRAAFNKIQQKLPVQKKSHAKTGCGVNEHKKQPGNKRKIQTNNDGFDEAQQAEILWYSESSETEYIVEDVLTSRGRKAKRISYAYMHEYGRTHEGSSEKQRKVSDGITKEKKEVKCGNNLNMKKYNVVRKDDHFQEESNENNLEFTGLSKDVKLEVENDNLVTPMTEKSESVDELERASKESQQLKEEQHTADTGKGDEKQQLTVKKGLQTYSHSSSGTVLWKKRKVSRTGTLTCQDCNFVTTSKSLLDIHSRRHTGIKPYVCPDCGKAFPQSSGLNVHIKRHKGQRDYACDYCDYKAYTKVDKLRHMTIHTGERNQICQYCGKAFAKDSTLREHVRSIHERPFKHICSECGFTTYRANNLRVHIRMRHRGEYNNHVCPVCGARVKQRNAFLEHMRSHTGEKPYRCDQCDSSFACHARLTVHRKSVHEPRQYTCSHCCKTFQTKHHLIRHNVIHTKEKPFTCPFCTYSCNTQGNMTKHVKTIHHLPHFSYKKYKAEQESDTLSNNVNPEWVEKGQRVTEEYLKDLSTKLGRNVTLEELRAKENEKQKKIDEEAEQAKIKRLNRILAPEHSYHSRVSKIVSLDSKSNSARMETDVDPATLILQVAAENADNFVESLNEGDESSQSQIVQVDLLSGIGNEEHAESESSSVSPHIVQMLSNINSDNSKIIHIHTSNELPTSKVERNGEYGTVILSGSENSDFTTGQIYELVSGQNLRLCLNAELIDATNGNTIQVLQEETLEKKDVTHDIGQQCDKSVTDLSGSEYGLPDKDIINDETSTVVVIINTDQTPENAL